MSYTWFKGFSVEELIHSYFSSEWDEEVRMIKQEIILRIISDYVPLQLMW